MFDFKYDDVVKVEVDFTVADELAAFLEAVDVKELINDDWIDRVDVEVSPDGGIDLEEVFVLVDVLDEDEYIDVIVIGKVVIGVDEKVKDSVDVVEVAEEIGIGVVE